MSNPRPAQFGKSRQCGTCVFSDKHSVVGASESPGNSLALSSIERRGFVRVKSQENGPCRVGTADNYLEDIDQTATVWVPQSQESGPLLGLLRS